MGTTDNLETGMRVEVTLVDSSLVQGLYIETVVSDFGDCFGRVMVDGCSIASPYLLKDIRALGWASTYVNELSELLHKRSVALADADRKVVALTRDVQRLERALGAKWAEPIAAIAREQYIDKLREQLQRIGSALGAKAGLRIDTELAEWVESYVCMAEVP